MKALDSFIHMVKTYMDPHLSLARGTIYFSDAGTTDNSFTATLDDEGDVIGEVLLTPEKLYRVEVRDPEGVIIMVTDHDSGRSLSRSLIESRKEGGRFIASPLTDRGQPNATGDLIGSRPQRHDL